jgi:hypothetical protein
MSLPTVRDGYDEAHKHAAASRFNERQRQYGA